MAFRFRLCSNDTTTVLRELFQATPLRIPESSVQPLLVIAEKAGKTDKRGELKFLLLEGSDFQVPIKESPVSNVSLERTRSMDWDFGLKLLDNFFKGFNLPAASIGNQLVNAKEVSLSFHNVRRRWLDKNELGSALRGKNLDLQHPSAAIFLGPEAYNLLIVSDIIVSNGFSINVTKSSDNGFEVEVPAFQEIVNEAKTNLQVKSASKNSIGFEGEEFLTFAFTCVKLDLNPQTGALSVGNTIVTRESMPGGETKEIEEPQPVELDDDHFEPGMLEWD